MGEIGSGFLTARIVMVKARNKTLDKTDKRYLTSLDLLREAISVTYRAYIFDNSGPDSKLIAEVFQGKLKIIEPVLPNWFLYAFSKK